MRARWVKPEFFFDRKLAAMGAVAALVYQSLWLMADDYGTAPCDPDRIKGTMFFAWDSIEPPEIAEHCAEFAARRMVVRYRVGDDVYCRIRSWAKHQQVHKPGKFRYPTTGAPLEGDPPEISGDSSENSEHSHLLDTHIPITTRRERAPRTARSRTGARHSRPQPSDRRARLDPQGTPVYGETIQEAEARETTELAARESGS